MGLIFQIILTVIAWNRGWKWLSLIPLGVMLFLGFMIGLIGGSQGYTPDDMSWTIVLDLIGFVVLIIMASVKPKSARLEETPKPAPVVTETVVEAPVETPSASEEINKI